MHIASKLSALWMILGVGVMATSVGAQPASPGSELAANLFERARPILEETLGSRLAQPPTFRQATPEEWQQLTDPLMRPQLRWQFPDLTVDGLNRAVAGAERAWRRSLLAGALPGSNCIVLFANAPLWQQLLAAGLPAGTGSPEADAFLQLVLVQEAARAVLDRKYALSQRLFACSDGEEFQALQAVVEGRVQWITRQVARRLGTEQFCPLLARCLLLVPDDEPDVSLRDVGQTMLHRRHWACEAGLAFFEFLDQQGIRDAEARVFAQPPRQVDWINHPERFCKAQQEHRPELAKTLSRLADALPAAEWAPAQQPWTPDMVREAAVLLGARERAEKVLAAWDEGRSLIWTSRAGAHRQVMLGVVRFTSAAGARAYQGLALDLQRKQDELLGDSRFGGPVTSQTRTVEMPGVEEATRTDKSRASGAPVISTLLGRDGCCIVELSWYGGDADMPWAVQLVRRLLDGLAAAN